MTPQTISNVFFSPAKQVHSRSVMRHLGMIPQFPMPSICESQILPTLQQDLNSTSDSDAGYLNTKHLNWHPTPPVLCYRVFFSAVFIYLFLLYTYLKYIQLYLPFLHNILCLINPTNENKRGNRPCYVVEGWPKDMR